MSFWTLLLVVGLITWTVCVFLRAVAVRADQLRKELVPVFDDEAAEEDGSPEAPVTLGSPEPVTINGTPPKAKTAAKPNGKPHSNGKNNGRSPAGRSGH